MKVLNWQFQFPSNGKDFPNAVETSANRLPSLLFQFPSNGKDFPNAFKPNLLPGLGWFQFPSNGKDFPNAYLEVIDFEPFKVSIPFKREGLSEHNTRYTYQYHRKKSFNSLQTGRTFRTIKGVTHNDFQKVSIPFKREGLSERPAIHAELDMYKRFQFPSNGKDFPNKIKTGLANPRNLEFQFPSNGKDFPNKIGRCCCKEDKKFQFPSNGKDFPNNVSFRSGVFSIKFQFPSNGKDFPNLMAVTLHDLKVKFQFPSNGKDFPNSNHPFHRIFCQCKFQFPSNGKDFPNLLSR